MNIVEEKFHGQGVISEIIFPLDRDQIAVSKAIFQLLDDGWKFHRLDETGITLSRRWEA